ncbi:hypothetical protein E2I00_018187, partial [Balaenoptera physalus]
MSSDLPWLLEKVDPTGKVPSLQQPPRPRASPSPKLWQAKPNPAAARSQSPSASMYDQIPMGEKLASHTGSIIELQAGVRVGGGDENKVYPHPTSLPQLPDFVRRELRRAYGTYPRTDVRVTYRGGEFLLQGAPRVREPEYRTERRVLRRPASSCS